MCLNDLLFLLDSTQITFIVIVSIIGFLLLLTIIAIPVIAYVRKKKYRELSYYKIRDVVLNNDYYLINNFKFKIDDKTSYIVDHIIGGDKYFYIISDYYFGSGSLTGNINDQSLIYTNKKGKKKWKEILDKCREIGIPQVTFTGGEPTMRDDLFELIKYGRWFVTRLNTNGIKLTKEYCAGLKEAEKALRYCGWLVKALKGEEVDPREF